VVVKDNDPEDIRAMVVEMIEQLEGRVRYEDEDLALRTRAEKIYATVAKKLYDSSGGFGGARLARDFVRKHKSFIR
jgi:hypothetical protein